MFLLVDAKYIVYPYGRVHEDARGWIDIQYAGTHFLGFDVNRVLYASPKRESDTCMFRANYQLLKIMDVDNYWLKVYYEGDESIIGWLAPEDSDVTGEAFDRLYPSLFFVPGTQIFDLDTRLSPYVSVYEIKGNKALVDIISEDGDLLYYKIWVDTDLLGTYIHNDCGSIDVYDNLDSEEVSFKINDGKWGVFYPVTDIWRLGWVKIVNPENKNQTGWLSPEYRSANQHFPTTLIR